MIWDQLAQRTDDDAALSLTSAKAGALVGVFISVITIPAAANIGTALVAGRPGDAAGAALQLGVDVVRLLLSAVLTLLVQRALLRRRLHPRR